MEIDLAQAGSDPEHNLSELRADVCIVGGGIAGLVLADRLCTAGVDVVLVEAGGASSHSGEEGRASQIELAGEPHLGSRDGQTRALGGSSNTWGGQLLPLPDDARWPVPLSELEPHYPAVHRLLAVDELSYGPEQLFSALAVPVPRALGDMPRLVPRLSKFAPFGKRNLGVSLGRKLSGHREARVLLHAEATGIDLNLEGDRVTAVNVQGPGGKPLRVQARHTVLAAGTVETCRLLLLSRSRQPNGLGNGHDQVGRNFHDHLTLEVARFAGAARDRAVALFQPWLLGGLRGTVHALKFQAHHELRRKLHLNDALAHVTFEEPPDSGLAAVRQILRARQQGGGAGDLLSHLRALPRAGLDLLRMQGEALVHSRRYVSSRATVALRVNVAQQVPNRSRVRLGDATDHHGRRSARVDWHHAPADLRTIRVMAGYLRKSLVHLGLGETDGVVWRSDVAPTNAAGWVTGAERLLGEELTAPIAGIEDARHPMGGACLGTDPRCSVVDPQLRVHGISNLWVASAAVFPDGSPQLPTLTLMALAMRLAGQLQRALRSDP